MKSTSAEPSRESSDGTRARGTRNPVARSAARSRDRNRDRARQLRRTGRIASLAADVSGAVESMAAASEGFSASCSSGRTALDGVASELDRSGAAWESCLDALGELEDAAESAFDAILDIGEVFEESDGTLARVLEDLGRVAALQHGLQDEAAGFAGTADTCAGLSELVDRIADLADVASLNAGLETGRDDDVSAVFTAIADRIRAAAARAAALQEDVGTVIDGLAGKGADLAGRHKDNVDRVRSVTVMCEGVKSAYADLAADIGTMRDNIGDISVMAGEVSPADEASDDPFTMLPEALADARVRLEDLMAVIDGLDDIMAPLVDHAEYLATLSSQVPPDNADEALLEDLADAAGEVGGATGDLHDAVEAASRASDDALLTSDNLIRQAERMAEAADKIRQTMSVISETASSVDETGERVSAMAGESAGVLAGIAREIDALLDGYAGFIDAVNIYAVAANHVGDTAARFAAFAGEVRMLSNAVSIELSRDEKGAGALSDLPGKLGEVAGLADEAAVTASRLSMEMETATAVFGARYARISSLMEPGALDGPAGDAAETMKERLGHVGDEAGSIARAAKEMKRHTGTVASSMGRAHESASGFADSCSGAADRCEEYRVALASIGNAAERIGEVVEGMTGE